MTEEEKNKLNSEAEQSAPEEKVTITPAMIDSEGDEQKSNKVDLSAIIPEQNQQATENDIILNSREKDLKTDGSVVLGILKNEDEVEVKTGVTLPEAIDIAKRKEELKKHKDKKQHKKEPKKKLKTKEQRIQNTIAIIALAAMGIIGFTVYYIFNAPTKEDFETLPIQVELGDKLPAGLKNYVKPGLGGTMNEMAYTLDTSQVIIDKIGEYIYTVTYMGQMKEGTISVVDTTPPTVTVRENVTIIEGEEYTPETFVLDCTDYTGCNYSFEDANTTKKYKKPGSYTIHIVAKDAYKNKEVKKAYLKIESTGMVKKYLKKDAYNAEKGYSKEYRYELHYEEFGDSPIILNGTYQEKMIYEDDAKFEAAKKEFVGELNYLVDKDNKTIIYEVDANTVGNYGDMSNVHNYLIGQGYSEE
jgi:hypothetical protein